MASLTTEESTIIKRILIEDEGFKKFPYLDCCKRTWKNCSCVTQGKLTIGIGRNLDDVGMSEMEVLYLQENDVTRVAIELDHTFPWFQSLNTSRRIVILSMAFNLGIHGLKNFRNMIQAIEAGDFELASLEMLQSSWSIQVKGRADRLADIMKNGHI